jgi:hypothetical protein
LRGCVLWALCGLLLPRPGQASPPPAQALSPRELLALSPQAVSALPAAAASAARERLALALAAQAAAGLRPLLLPAGSRLPPAVQLPLPPVLQRVLALDLQRRAQKQEPVLVGVLLKEALKPLAAAQLLAPPEPPGQASAHLRLPAELTPRSAAVLRRLCERAAEQWPTLLEGATVRLMPGVPFAALLSQPESVIYINPVVLTLTAAQQPADDPDDDAPLPIDGERTLTYRSIADCAQKVRARCQTCLGGDAAECAAVRATLGSIACQGVFADLGRLKELCFDHALRLGSVADCLNRADPACTPGSGSEHCVALVDACIAAPATADGGSRDGDDDRPTGGDCGCSAGWAEACGHFGRQSCQPFGEHCGDKVGQLCTESCSDCLSECNKGCSDCNRECSRSCKSTSNLCNSCNQGCQGFSSQCNSGCADCSRSCNQCNSECNQCGSSCNQCNNDCSRCSSDCNQCNNDCNQCNSDCNQCNSGCNDCNGGGCNDCNGGNCNGQCSVVEVRGRYPQFPIPPGPAAPPSRLARLLVGARGTVGFVLPPLLFLWWRRRLHAARRQRAEPAP